MTSLISSTNPTVIRETSAKILPLTRSSRAGGFLISASGGVYSEHGKFCTASRVMRPSPDYFDADDLPLELGMPTQRLMAGIYGGVIFDQYGHFLVESMARLWILQKDTLPNFPVIFHTPPGFELRDYQIAILKRVGIYERIILCQSYIQVDHLVVPEPAFKYAKQANYAFLWPFEKIKNSIGSCAWKDRVYISRTKLQSSVSVGEAELEEIFRSDDYRICYPETLTFEEQLRIFRSGNFYAGVTGSALHNLLFSENGTSAVYINRFNKIRQTFKIIDHLRNLRASYIPGYEPVTPEPVESTDPAILNLDRVISCLRDCGAITRIQHGPRSDPAAQHLKYKIVAYLKRAEKHRLAGRNHDALKECELGLGVSKDDQKLLIEKAKNFASLGEGKIALAICMSVVGKNNKNESAIQMALEMREHGLSTPECETLVQSLELICERAKYSSISLSKWYVSRGDYCRAVMELERIKINDLQSHALRAKTYLGMNLEDKALDELIKAFEKNNSDKFVLVTISRLYEKKGDLDSAYVFIKRASKLYSGDKFITQKLETIAQNLNGEMQRPA